MALKRIIDLPEDLTPDPAAYLPTDDFTGGSKRSPISAVVEAAGATVFQPLSSNLTTVAGVTPAAAGLAILADALPADTRSYLTAIPHVADTTALAALDPAKDPVVLFNDDTGFEWREVDSTTAVSFDTNHHMVVQSTFGGGIPITTGAWYRRLKGDRPGVREAFGAIGDGSGVDDTAALQDAIYWMEYYSPRTRALTFERGLYDVSQLHIPNELLGVSFNGSSFWDATIRCSVIDANPVILNESQEFKMFDMSLLTGVSSNSAMWNAHKIGVKNDRGIDQPADVDFTMSRVRIAGFESGVMHRGRGLSAHNNHVSSCRWGINFDFYDTDDYTGWDFEEDGTTPVDYPFTDEAAFRGFMISNTRFHSMDYAAIANFGQNAHKMCGLNVSNIQMDIGRRLFYGHLGRDLTMVGAKSINSRTEIFELTGGENFVISNIVGGGGSKGILTSTPDNVIVLTDGTTHFSDPYDPVTNPDGTTGVFTVGTFANMVLMNSEGHAIIDTASKLDDVTFRNIKGRNIGYESPSTSRLMSINSKNGDINFEGVSLYGDVGDADLNAIIGNNFSTNMVKARGLKRVNSTTPFTVGSIITDKRQSYTPVIVTGSGTVPDPYVVTGTNVATSPLPTVSALDWGYEDDDWIVLAGRFTAAVISTASDGEIDLELPVASTFTNASQAYGSFICSTSGQNIAGSVNANGSRLKLRWKAGSTSNFSFSFSARYRKL